MGGTCETIKFTIRGINMKLNAFLKGNILVIEGPHHQGGGWYVESSDRHLFELFETPLYGGESVSVGFFESFIEAKEYAEEHFIQWKCEMSHNVLFVGGCLDGEMRGVKELLRIYQVPDLSLRSVADWGACPVNPQERIDIHLYHLERIHSGNGVFHYLYVYNQFQHEDLIFLLIDRYRKSTSLLRSEL